MSKESEIPLRDPMRFSHLAETYNTFRKNRILSNEGGHYVGGFDAEQALSHAETIVYEPAPYRECLDIKGLFESERQP